jgi:hypothetical protein
MDNQPSNYDLAIGFLQVFDLLLNLSQVSNDDILKELQHQNNDYLEKIIEDNKVIIQQNRELLINQSKIIRLLENNPSMSLLE